MAKPVPNSGLTERVARYRDFVLHEERVLTTDQARIITEVYKENPGLSRIRLRALALKASMEKMPIRIVKDELLVGNRSERSCGGVVFPEGGISWVVREIDDLPVREQDVFAVREDDREYILRELKDFWQGLTLEEHIAEKLPKQIRELEIVGKLNQKDHAQGHIAPDVEKWLKQGVGGLLSELKQAAAGVTDPERCAFYEAAALTLEGVATYYLRYANLAGKLKEDETDPEQRELYALIESDCRHLSVSAPVTFRQALQALWMLFVVLQLESNASSFSPGRIDQYLNPFLERDLASGLLTVAKAQELTDALFVKFNEIVYMRNRDGARYFAGFPIGFNMCVGGKAVDGSDQTNMMSWIALNSVENTYMRQPNMSARIHKNSPPAFLKRISEVIGNGSGMPQIFNDEIIIPTLISTGYSEEDAYNYCIVGCVEISVPGRALGFSDAGMYNMLKALELTLNGGTDMRSGRALGLKEKNLAQMSSYEEFESIFLRQNQYFVSEMIKGLAIVEEAHRLYMPSPFLSTVIDDCIASGVDVTAGGARYNFSGIQLIQVANLADSLAALKLLVFEEGRFSKAELLEQLQNDFPDEIFRQTCLYRAPKYGNDIARVDELGKQWVEEISEMFLAHKNYRGGNFTIGLYTVSAHVPMGAHVAATPDGRRAGEPLADGGLSAVYGRDVEGPTALLNSVARIDAKNANNGSLLNVKFNPELFKSDEGLAKFVSLLQSFVQLPINHMQVNVVNKEDLIDAQNHPEKHRDLLVRVAGYTANFTDLAKTLQDEIIARTEYIL